MNDEKKVVILTDNNTKNSDEKENSEIVLPYPSYPGWNVITVAEKEAD